MPLEPVETGDEIEVISERSTLGATPSDTKVQARIRALEKRLDGLIRSAVGPEPSPPEPPQDDSPGPRFEPLGGLEGVSSFPQATGSAAEAALAAQQLFSNPYSARQWGRTALRARSEDVDEFGCDPSFERHLEPVARFLYRRYFRVQTRGIRNIPDQGRCVVVSNHSGTVPLDGAMLRTAVRLEHPKSRELRWLAEDFVYYLPFLGVWFSRVGAVRACPENAERLLHRESLVAVFPEGVHGIKKLYGERYRLQRFGRGGYIRLCLRTSAPLIPCAVIGAEETNPMLYRVDYLSRLVGLPYLPITPTFPWLGPLGLLPAPCKWKIFFGEPIAFDGYGPEAADDHVLVGRLSERVQKIISDMLESGLRSRSSVWFG
ncbi:MAG TPA: lysophospholipid acyltransferase family protein [Polyangiaceae bacterium]